MSSKVAKKLDAKEFVRLYEIHGSVKAVHRATGIGWRTVHTSYTKACADGLMDAVRPGRKTDEHMTKTVKGQLRAKKNDEKPPLLIEGKLRATAAPVLPRRAKGNTIFYFTSAQNNTPLHDKLWNNMLVMAKHDKAAIHVSRFAYVKRGLGASGDKHSWMNNEKFVASKDIWFDPRIVKYCSDERAEVAPGLVWCGDANVLPTAARPLSGLEVFTGRKSGIFPHVKISMESIASSKFEPTKFNYTTGTITMRNYIARKEGLKAEFYHDYGFLKVEVTPEGNWFCRQVNADSDGTIHDLDVRVKNGKLTRGNRVEGITWGDIHVDQIDPVFDKLAWDKGGILDQLRPKFQFFHDVLDFFSRSHHEIKDQFSMHQRFLQRREGVRNEIGGVGEWLRRSYRPWCKGIVVDSNHDRHLARWLIDQDGRRDPVNFEFWSRMNSLVSQKQREADGVYPNIFKVAVADVCGKLPVTILNEDESFVICEEYNGGIECGQHGDRGANGARGGIRGFARIGRRVNIGHSHSAGIWDGAWQAGCSCILTPHYVHGPSSWSHSFIITYSNGKRAICTAWQGEWRA